jgi:hypothetical protein
MSVLASSWVWENSRSKGTARLILLSLADHAGQDGGDAYPSVARLSRRCGVSERTVQEALKVLVSLGELTIEANAGPHGVNRYQISMTPADSAPPQILRPADSAPDPRRSRTGGVQISHPTPADSAPEPSLTVLEPSVNRQSRSIATSLPKGFDRFWDIYPAKKAKRAAAKAWAGAVKRAPVETILEGAARYCSDERVLNGFIRNPATWLNDDGWNDEPTRRPRMSKSATNLASWAERTS